jgi:endonuclease/exonuclease/phosphatase family metal-dependent hydrolase
MRAQTLWIAGWLFTSCLSVQPAMAGETFRVATYNVENYLDLPTESRRAKPADSKAQVRRSIIAIRPDVLALQEMGTTNALLELAAALKADGLDLPYWEHVTGYDTNIFVAILSRFPIATRRPHSNESFLLKGRRHYVSRGFAEVEIEVPPAFRFTLLTAHLKSKRSVAEGDEAELRLEEAKLLRSKIDRLLSDRPDARVLVLGDLNDTQGAPSTRTVIGRGRGKLVDTRAPERGLDAPPEARGDGKRTVTWTHFFAREDLYSRVDYILLSEAMARHWVTNASFVLAQPDWGLASDHRPVVATFELP